MKVPTVLYDANVLYPAPLRDFLVRLAMEGLVRARWTETIHEEWMRSLLRNRPDLTEGRLRRTRELMDRAVRDSLIRGYEKRIDELALPDPDDRHVLAAAIHAKVDVFLTLNTRDFPTSALDPYGIAVRHPDDFAVGLLDDHAETVRRVVRVQRAALVSPSVPVEEFIETLREVGLIETAARIEPWRNEL